jgi:hypothetical protein
MNRDREQLRKYAEHQPSGSSVIDIIWKKIRSQILSACGDWEYEIGIDMVEDAVRRVLGDVLS